MPFQEARPLYIGSRPLSIGNTFIAIADGGEAGFWNPAGLVQWQGVKIFASAKSLDRESYAFDSKCVAYSYRDIGFFWGNKIAFRVEGEEISDFTYYSLARKLNPHMAIGGSVKFKRRHPCRYYQFFGHSPGYDLGILWKPDHSNVSGMLIQNMGDAKKWISNVVFGYSHRFSDRSALAVDMITLLDSEITLETHAGYEWWIIHWMALRAGMSDGHPTAGLGLKLAIFCLDYAWVRDDRGSSYYISGQVEL